MLYKQTAQQETPEVELASKDKIMQIISQIEFGDQSESFRKMAKQFYIQNLNKRKMSARRTSNSRRNQGSVLRGNSRSYGMDEREKTPTHFLEINKIDMNPNSFKFNNERGSMPVNSKNSNGKLGPQTNAVEEKKLDVKNLTPNQI